MCRLDPRDHANIAHGTLRLEETLVRADSRDDEERQRHAVKVSHARGANAADGRGLMLGELSPVVSPLAVAVADLRDRPCSCALL